RLRDEVNLEAPLRRYLAHRQARAVERDEALAQDVLHPLRGDLDGQVELLADVAALHHLARAEHVSEHVVSTELVTHPNRALDTHAPTDCELAERGARERLGDGLEAHTR